MNNSDKNQVLDLDSDSEEMNKKKENPVPQHSIRILHRRGVIRVFVHLHRISEKLINYSPTRDYFYLDTFRHTKKFLLKFNYPYNIRVDTTDLEAELNHGILKCDIKIVNWGVLSEKHSIVSKKIKELRAAKKKTSVDNVQSLAPNKRKSKKRKANTNDITQQQSAKKLARGNSHNFNDNNKDNDEMVDDNQIITQKNKKRQKKKF